MKLNWNMLIHSTVTGMCSASSWEMPKVVARLRMGIASHLSLFDAHHQCFLGMRQSKATPIPPVNFCTFLPLLNHVIDNFAVANGGRSSPNVPIQKAWICDRVNPFKLRFLLTTCASLCPFSGIFTASDFQSAVPYDK